MAKLVNQREWKLLDIHMEKPKGISMTVPDEAYSVREILERFVKTGRADGRLERQEGGYIHGADFDSPDLQQVSNMDVVDRNEVLDQVRSRNSEMKDLFSKKRKDKSAKADLARSAKADGQSVDSSDDYREEGQPRSKDRAKAKGATQGRSEAIDEEGDSKRRRRSES